MPRHTLLNVPSVCASKKGKIRIFWLCRSLEDQAVYSLGLHRKGPFPPVCNAWKVHSASCGSVLEDPPCLYKWAFLGALQSHNGFHFPLAQHPKGTGGLWPSYFQLSSQPYFLQQQMAKYPFLEASIIVIVSSLVGNGYTWIPLLTNSLMSLILNLCKSVFKIASALAISRKPFVVKRLRVFREWPVRKMKERHTWIREPW